MIHLIKLAVGSETVEMLQAWQAERRERAGRLYHRTRMMPRRAEEITDGGSIYWVIKGLVQVRQRVLAIERTVDEEGEAATLLILDPKLVRTWPQPWQIFQGWRYLAPEAAPADLDRTRRKAAAGLAEMPPEMLAELRELGLL